MTGPAAFAFAIPQRCALLFAAAILAVAVAPAQDAGTTATLYGTVRDAKAKPIAAVELRLELNGQPTRSVAQTDAQGKYSFHSLRAGVYSVKAVHDGYLETTIGSVFLAEKQLKVLDLTLEPAKPSASAGSPATPQFFDPPRFTVSGITDTTSLGGHGSDVVVKTRDTIAKDTVTLGKAQARPAAPESEKSLRDLVERDPGSFHANHALGKLLMEQGNNQDAIFYLQRADELNSNDNENATDLSLAYARAGDYSQARVRAEALIAHSDTARSHHLLGDIEEKSGNSLEAVREYQRAAELDASESNLFDWGSELLLHHAPEPAEQVFENGVRRFPRSIRLRVGWGAAEFAGGSPEKAVAHICEASDLKPGDPVPYLFLGKLLPAENTPRDPLVQKLQRFVKVHPELAEANYYYAVALWKKNQNNPTPAVLLQIETFLEQALRINPGYGEAYMQLGVLHGAEKRDANAIADLEHAVQVTPDMEEAHYRLAQAYRASGQTEKAKTEVQRYQELSQEAAQNTERERHEIRQFVYTLRDPAPGTNSRN
jgi:tetratricopeptide (TPR) repeat protein